MSTFSPTGTTEWARKHGEGFSWTCATDNYEPPRSYAHGEGWYYDGETRGPGRSAIVLEAAMALKDATKALYLIDDGITVRPFYVAGWHPDGVHVLLNELPVNVKADGTPRLRADNNRPVDFSNWMLGPRRAYHLKVR